MPLRIRRNPLVYPAGRAPGFNRSHPAAGITRFSGISFPGGFLNLLGPPGVLSSAPASSVLSSGPATKFVNVADAVKFAGNPAVNDLKGTIAGIFVFNGADGTIFTTSDTDAGIMLMEQTNAIRIRTGAVNTVTGLGVAIGVPYFCAASINSTAANVVLLRLDNGVITTATCSPSAPTTSSGTYIVGNWQALTLPTNGWVLATMFSTAFLAMPQLLAWAADPWSFWYPQDDAYSALVGVVASALVLGWQRGIDDFGLRPPRIFEGSPALALTPATLPPKIAGMAWFQPLDQPTYGKKLLDQLIAQAPMPPPSAVPIAGMAWFTPLDPLPRPAPKPHWGPASSLTPGTLPVAIAGMGWFAPLDDLPRKWKPLFDLPAWAAQAIGQAASTIAGMAWFVQAQEAPRRVFAPDTAGALAGSPAPFVGLGWYVRWQELPAPRALPAERPSFVAPPPIPAIAALGWQRFDDILPARARQQGDIGAGVALTPATLPAKISGMAWFAPLDDLPRKWKPLSDLPAWSPQTIAASFLVGNPEYVVGYRVAPSRKLPLFIR